MAYQNYSWNNYGWRCPSEEYPVYDPPVEAIYPRHHKGHVTFATIYEEDPVAEVEAKNFEQRYQSTGFNSNHRAYKSVDQEADAFIQHEHKRMEMARLMSQRGA
ncbi:unnamed protein product [Sphenostylis stenocarpa]|uniref:Uncharacterized protein n=1 Tax=Sphenostylis stenocarpa TaxID=92480 RepID=A0AA86VBY8_9FABA|nr:unnamed protein product [Sphenostylis stenocarpa]